MPAPRVRLVAAEIGQGTTAEGRHEASLHQGGFPRAAVAHHHDEGRVGEAPDEFLCFTLAAEEQPRFAFLECAQPNERMAFQRRAEVPRLRLEDGAQQAAQQVGVRRGRAAGGVVLLGEGGQIPQFRLPDQQRDEGKAAVARGPGDCEAHLALHPVDGTTGVYEHREGGGLPRDGVFELRLPFTPRDEVALVEPDLEAGGLRVGRVLDRPREREGRLGVCAGVGEEE